MSVEEAREERDRLERDWRKRREALVAARAAAAEAVRVAKAELAEAERGEEGAPCPVCGRPLGAEALAWRKTLADRVFASEERLRTRTEELEVPTPDEVVRAPSRLRAAELRAEAARQSQSYPAGFAALIEEIEALAPAAERAKALAGADRRLRDAESRYEKANEEAKRASIAAATAAADLRTTGFDDPEAARAALARAAAARSGAEAAGLALRTAEASLRSAERAAQAAEERLQEARARRDALRAAKHQEALNGAVATEMRALRTALNGALRPDLEARAGELLERMTAGRYRRVKLGTDFEPTVVDEETDRAVLSGGEEDVVALALRLALAERVQDRGGHALTLLMLDEAFGALDAERRQSLLDVLVGLRDRYAQLIVVTHIEDVAQVADRVLRVTRDATGAARVEEA